MEVSYEIGFQGLENPAGTINQFIGECQAACAPIANINDSKAISAINPVVSKYNHCDRLEGTATLYKSIDGSPRTVVHTWQLEAD